MFSLLTATVITTISSSRWKVAATHLAVALVVLGTRDVVVEDNYSSHDDVDDEVEDPNDDEITEDNYSTMMDLGSEDPDDEAANLIDYVDE